MQDQEFDASGFLFDRPVLAFYPAADCVTSVTQTGPYSYSTVRHDHHRLASSEERFFIRENCGGIDKRSLVT